jgi:hypothetical protein
MSGSCDASDPDRLAHERAGLGYPGFAHLQSLEAYPAAVFLEALIQPDLSFYKCPEPDERAVIYKAFR